jgi:hypothetical protein
MNLYLVLALALGVSAPSVQPRLTSVISVRAERRAVCGPASAGRLVRDRLKPVRTSSSPRAARLVNTGAATPRAPASSR